MTDTIHYAGRKWTEPEIWELCAALDAARYGVAIRLIDGWDVRIWCWDTQCQSDAPLHSTNGPSPWPALRAAVLALETEED